MSTTNTAKLRLSYSLLNCWSSGNKDEAIAMYLHTPIEQTFQMKWGTKFHEKLADAGRNHKKVKIGNTTFEFKNPTIEKKIIVPFNSRWDLSGTPDSVDDRSVYEWKSGVKSAVDYANGYQAPFYFLLLERAGVEVDRAYIVHYNQYIKKADWVIVRNSKEQVEKAENYIESLAPDIQAYFELKNVPLGKGGEHNE